MVWLFYVLSQSLHGFLRRIWVPQRIVLYYITKEGRILLVSVTDWAGDKSTRKYAHECYVIEKHFNSRLIVWIRNFIHSLRDSHVFILLANAVAVTQRSKQVDFKFLFFQEKVAEGLEHIIHCVTADAMTKPS